MHSKLKIPKGSPEKGLYFSNDMRLSVSVVAMGQKLDSKFSETFQKKLKLKWGVLEIFPVGNLARELAG